MSGAPTGPGRDPGSHPGSHPESRPVPIPRFDERGLVPVVVQDDATGEVLMLAWADATAIEATARTGQAHFWSRSRGAPWRKGETSGNTMDVVALRADCDGDAILYRVRPAGPACHTGAPSCFFRERTVTTRGGDESAEWLDVPTGPGGRLDELPHLLERVIDERRGDADAASYTALLWRRGEAYVARKVTEEAAEVVDAAARRTPRALAEEAADLAYHLFVLLRMKGVSWRDVLAVLRERRAGHGRGAKD
jgi:phosphoribosyl-ATP pyrophosphohydrolase/phosphoribosyl-AMP cyclohydrolase